MALPRGSWGRVTLAISVCLAAGSLPLACGNDDSKPIITTGGGGPVGGGKDGSGSTSETSTTNDGQATTDGTTTQPDGAPIDTDSGDDGGSIPDAPVKDAPSDGSEGGGKITFDGGTAHVRLVHAAPDGAPIDMCVRSSGTTAWGTPVLGGGTGLAFANGTDAGTFLDGYYDIAIVLAPASDCTSTTTITLSVPFVDTMTIAYIETIVPPSNVGFEIAPINVIGTPVAGQAAVRLNVTQGQSIDLYGLQGATSTLWFPGASPGRSTNFFGVPGGTYSIRANIATGAAQLLQVDNVTLANSDVLDLFLYSSFPGKTDTYNLLRCPVSSGGTSCIVN